MPSQRGSPILFWTTASLRAINCRRCPAGESVSSTTTETAFSTFTAFKGGVFLPASSTLGGPALPEPGRRHVRGRHQAIRPESNAGRLRPRRISRRLRQRRALRYLRDPVALVCPVPQPRRRYLRGRDAKGRACRCRDWPTSSAFADLDNDGDLDLYVCHYGVWDPENPRICKDPTGRVNIACDPRSIAALPDHVFRNDSGRFVDVTAEAGVIDRDGRGLGVAAADLDGDGLVDLFVANDTTANLLFRNLGRFRFEEVGQSAGVAANAGGGFQAGMGVACGDLDGDGLIDLGVTNFYGESTTFFHNLGQGLFADHTNLVGLAAPSRYVLGFGAAFLDADNDGRLDLMTANGHVSDLRPHFPYAMTAQLYRGGADGRLTDITLQAGPPFEQLHVGRGLAVGDLDNDGRLDALMAAQNEPTVYYHNRAGTGGMHFVTFQLEGTKSNRDGVGAVVEISAGARRQVAQRVGGSSFQSANDHRIHFGLGPAARIESVNVRWPSGTVDQVHDFEADRGYLLKEGARALRLLEGVPRREN